jgi:hypothetical protein
VALWLGGCGGSGEPAGPASVPAPQGTLRSVDLPKYDMQRLALPDSMRGVGGSKLDPRLAEVRRQRARVHARQDGPLLLYRGNAVREADLIVPR